MMKPLAWTVALALAGSWLPVQAAAQRLRGDAQTLRQWVQSSADNAGAPFMIIDKRLARVWVFDGKGVMRGSSPVLLGQARGDDSVPGIGTRPLAQVRPDERTTPAGRFVVEPGRNTNHEDVFWIDYDAAVSMHRVRATNPSEKRLQRLSSPSPADNRISYGCINVPVQFFNAVVQPGFSRRGGVAYVLPEVRPLRTVFSLARPRTRPLARR
jgi:hypothetical protein